MKKIEMVNLVEQYHKIKDEVDSAISQVIESSAFINGLQVKSFADNLGKYLSNGAKSEIFVIPCGNGTDALQISLMALGLKAGDEVIVPAFTYVASAEAIALLGLKPVMVDVDYDTFNVTIDNIKRGFSNRTKAIIPVHLFGQSCDMEPILEFAKEHNLFVIEDNAQAIGADYTFSNGTKVKTGTMGSFGCTSFFPSKNLGCFGDGGAIITKDSNLALNAKMIANHGQKIKYYHSVIGCNSRLDTLQAAVLNVKLKYLDEYCRKRNEAARYYTQKLKELDPNGEFLVTPFENKNSTHVYHQYTLKIKKSYRDKLKEHLAKQEIPSMIYYPLPLNEQDAFKGIAVAGEDLKVSKELAFSVLSLPIHTELTTQTQDIIIDAIKSFASKFVV